MLCIYRYCRLTMTAKGSGAAVKSAHPQIELLGLNHGIWEILLSRNSKSAMIWWWCAILPLPMKYMFELSNRLIFNWIDHHASVIEEYEAMLRERGKTDQRFAAGIGTAATGTDMELLLSRPAGSVRVSAGAA